MISRPLTEDSSILNTGCFAGVSLGFRFSMDVGFRSLAAAREMAALLCRRYTSVTLVQIGEHFALQHPR